MDAGLQISYLDGVFRDASKRRTVELFESSGPRIVSRKQYEDIMAAQKQKKLAFEYNLGYVIEQRFYAIAPLEAREEMDEICPDVESAEDFASAVPEQHKGVYEQAVKEIRGLCASGRLAVFYRDEDAAEAEPLLAGWKVGRLSAQDTVKLVDMLYITGQQLYDCDELPEWKDYMDSYSRFMFADEDERFWRSYAVLDDCPQIWLAEDGCFKGPEKPSEWITRSTELNLGLTDFDGKPKKSIAKVGAELQDKLDTALLNIRLFLAGKAILDAAVEAVEIAVPGNESTLANPNTRLGAFIAIYNIRLDELDEDVKSSKSGATRLEKALKMLPRIEMEKLKPSPESLKQLRNNVLKDAQGYDWLRTTIRTLEYEDGFSFRDFLQ